MKPLDGRVALVVGGSRGIGLGAGRSLGRDGALVTICSLREHLDEGVAALSAAGIAADAIAADVRDPDDVDRLVEQVGSKHDGIDILVNAAGIQRYGTVDETDEATWDEVMDVNVKSMYLTSRRVIPEMRRKGGGSIVNVSSVQAYVAQRGAAAYVASKGGINALTRAMAVDHAHENIRVNAVCPGSDRHADAALGGGPVPRRAVDRRPGRRVGPLAPDRADRPSGGGRRCDRVPRRPRRELRHRRRHQGRRWPPRAGGRRPAGNR